MPSGREFFTNKQNNISIFLRVGDDNEFLILSIMYALNIITSIHRSIYKANCVTERNAIRA